MNRLWDIIRKIVVFFLKILYKILHRELTDEAVDAFMQFVKFGIVGVSNTAVSYIIYWLSLTAFQKLEVLPNTDYLVAQFIGFLLSVLWSFYWNNKYVFKKGEGEQRSIWKALFKAYVSYAFTGIFLNSIMSVLWVEVLDISKLLAPIINLLVSVPLNFFMNKLWAFRTKKKDEEGEEHES